MWMSVFIIILILAMGYYWGAQGGFSSLLHLIATILAGVCGLGLFDVLGPLFGQEAGRGIALLLCFGLSLLVFRNLMNFFIPQNVELQAIASWVIGVACGAGSAILTAGIVCIGLLNFPYVAASFDYHPYGDDGRQVTANPTGNLWVPADRITAGFYSLISRGSFNPLLFGDPIDHTHPNLILSSARHDLAEGQYEGMLRGIDPGAVSIKDVYLLEPASELLRNMYGFDKNAEEATTLFALTTTITLNKDGVFNTSVVDNDNIFRIKSQQIALIYQDADKRYQSVSPVAFSRDNKFSHFRNEIAWTTRTADFTWVFQLPSEAKPQTIRIKQHRLGIRMNDVKNKPDELAAMTTLGNIDDEAKPVEDDSIQTVMVNKEMPFRVSLQYTAVGTAKRNDKDNTLMRYAGTELDRLTERDKDGFKFRDFSPKKPGEKIVRVYFNVYDSKRIFGSIKNEMNILESIPYLLDSEEKQYFPIGWASITQSRNKMRLFYDAEQAGQFATLKQMRFSRIASGRTLELYFSLPAGITLTEFRFPQAFNAKNIEIDNLKVE